MAILNLTGTEVRLAGAQKKLQKLRATAERHGQSLLKKQASLSTVATEDAKYWVQCDIEHLKDTISRNLKEILKAQAQLQKAQQDNATAKAQQAQVLIVPEVELFLSQWRQNVYDYTAEQYRLCKQELDAEDRTGGYKQHIQFLYTMDRKYGKQITQAVQCYSESERLERLGKDLDRDVLAKRADLFIRCSDVVGVLSGVESMDVGHDGALNGVVIGEKGRAAVQTIGAGGYNIQRYHYRVLVNKI